MRDDQDSVIVDGLQQGESISIFAVVSTDLLICGDRDQGDMDVFRLEDVIRFARNVLHVCVLANQ
jgi:hypothetical protein